MSFDGDLYPTAGATSVMITKGDMVDYNTIRQRLAIGSANQILQVKSSLPSWQTVPLADTVLTTAGDVLYEDATPALARLASGTQYNNLQMGATLPAWSASSTSVLTTTGDLLYASGANTLARLAGGTSGDVLTANGAGVAPTYQTPAGGGGKMELVDSTTLGSDTNDITTTFTAIPQSDISTIRCVCNGDTSATGASLALQVNGLTTSYEYTQVGTYNGTSIDVLSKTGYAYYKVLDGTGIPFYSTFDVNCNPASDTINIQSLSGKSDTSTNTNLYTVAGSNSTASQTSISEIKFYVDDASKDLLAGTTLSIYKITI